ncbi:MAG: hypothetical protein GXP55_22115 [Deltaproteobacteria bacterium]|nr:hypothetical protein [Deltaproteobacteria bacterium]
MCTVACGPVASTGSTTPRPAAPAEVEQAPEGQTVGNGDVSCTVTLGSYPAPMPATPTAVTHGERHVSAQATASAETHAEACRRAAARARADAQGPFGTPPVLNVDGVELAALMSPAAPNPPDIEGEERRCELVVAFAQGEPSTGTGEGPSLEAAVAVGRAQACHALGEASCADSEGFTIHVVRRSSSVSLANGARTDETQVTVELTRVRQVRAAANGPSRLQACRAAMESACGQSVCEVRELDGVRL